MQEVALTKEMKELLRHDLCSRLPYGVKAQFWGEEEEQFCYDTVDSVFISGESDEVLIGQYAVGIGDIKPYLFPMSGMTEEQKQEFISVAGYERREEDCGRHSETYYYDMVGHERNFYPNIDAIDWLNKNHFDYRGLIEKGLAIDATGLGIYQCVY